MNKEMIKKINRFLFSWRKGSVFYLAAWINIYAVMSAYLENPDWVSFLLFPFYVWVLHSGFKALGTTKEWHKKQYKRLTFIQDETF
jgi:hypothetical protein